MSAPNSRSACFLICELLVIWCFLVSSCFAVETQVPFDAMVEKISKVITLEYQIQHPEVLPFPSEVEFVEDKTIEQWLFLRKATVTPIKQLLKLRVKEKNDYKFHLSANEFRDVYYFDEKNGKKIYPVFELIVTRNDSATSTVEVRGVEYVEDKEECCGPHGPYMTYTTRNVSELFISRLFLYLGVEK